MKINNYLFIFLLFCSSIVFSQNGTVILDSIMSGGVYRSFRLYIPKVYKSNTPVPLVFNIHGYTMTAAQEEFYANFDGIADTANFIIVHPQGLKISPQGLPVTTGGDYGWTNFSPISEPNKDIQFLSDLLDHIKSKYAINLNRVYSTGMSNGGFMSYDLACFLSTRFAAVASVAGSINIQHFVACNPQHPIPVMQIHGTNDNTLPYDGDIVNTNIDSLVKFWVNFNHCNPTPTFNPVPNISVSDNSTAEHYVYTGGDNNSTVELYKIIGGSHSWPGTGVNSAGTNMDFSASKEIWRFFSQQKSFVGIDENPVDEISFSIFPNPSNGVFTLELKNNTHADIKIVDVLGETIFEEKITDSKTVINLNNKPSGIYFYQIKQQLNIIGNGKLIVR
jgi:polyhydroxybutyrate depolymerase